MKRALLLIIGLSALVWQPAPALGDSGQVKELNLVFLHGAGGTPCALQTLADSVPEQAQICSGKQPYDSLRGGTVWHGLCRALPPQASFQHALFNAIPN